jgi:large subunit ribosomal protein L29
MKTNEIRKMTNEEIIKKIEELKSELFDMRMKQATAALEKSHKINEDRKTIARLKTVLAERKNEGGEQ